MASNYEASEPTDQISNRIKEQSEEHIETQQKTFTKWVNIHLARGGFSTIANVLSDLKSGESLLNLLSVLTGMKLPPEKGSTRVHHLNNANRALDTMQKVYKVKEETSLVNISSDDIVNGSEKLTIALLWLLIQKWHESESAKLVADGVSDTVLQTSITELNLNLLQWCQKCTDGYHGVNIVNFSTSWRDGLGLLSLIHYYRPDLFHYESRLGKTAQQNLSLALHLASENLCVDRLIEPEDFTADQIDAKAVMTYLLNLRQIVLQEELENSGDEMGVSSEGSARSSNLSLNAQNNQSQEESIQTKNETTTSSAPTSGEAVRCDDMTAYREVIRSTIHWLTNAEKKLDSVETELASYQGQEESEIDPLKHHVTTRKLFETHEEFTNFLYVKQDDLARALQAGKSVQSVRELSNMEVEEISNESHLLTTRWDNLRQKSLTIQDHLHKVLMAAQETLLNAMTSVIEELEVQREKGSSKLGPDIDNLRSQIQLNQEIENLIEEYKPLATEALQQIIVFSDSEDEEDTDEATECQHTRRSRTSFPSTGHELEARIEDLASRWSEVIEWVRTQYDLLQEALLKWQHFEEEELTVRDWLAEKESTARDLLTAENQQPAAIQEWSNESRIQWLNFCRKMDLNGQAVCKALKNNKEVHDIITERKNSILGRWNKLEAAIKNPKDIDLLLCEPLKGSVRPSDTPITDVQGKKARLEEPFIISEDSTENRNEFEKTMESLENWLNATEEDLDLITRGNKPDSADNLRRVLHDLDKQEGRVNQIGMEMKEWEPKLDLFRNLGLRCKQDFPEDADQVDDIFEDLDQRWSSICEVFDESKAYIAALKKVDYVMQSVENKRDEIMGSAVWLQTATVQISEKSPTELQDLVITLNDRIGALKSLENQIQSFNRLCGDVKQVHSLVSVSHRLSDDIDSLMTLWSSTLNDYMSKLCEIELDDDNIINTLLDLTNWLSSTESQFNEDKVLITGLEELEDKQDHYDHLQKEFGKRSIPLKEIEDDSRSANPRITPEQLSNVKNKWRQVATKLDKRTNFLNDIYEKLNRLMNQKEAMERWMRDMADYLRSVDQADLNNEEAVSTQLGETQAAISDMESITPNIDIIHSLLQETQLYMHKDFEMQMKMESSNLQKQWNNMQTMAADNQRYLQHLLEQVRTGKLKQKEQIPIIVTSDQPDYSDDDVFLVEGGSCNQNERDVIQWVQAKKKEMEKSFEIETEVEWSKRHQLIQIIEEEFIKLKNEAENSQLLRTEVLKILHQFEDHLQEQKNQFKSSKYHYDDFKNLLDDENRWIKKAKNSMSRSMSKIHIDAEDLAEDINEIEMMFSEYSDEDYKKLNELKKSLMDANVFTNCVSEDFDNYHSQITETKSELKNRLTQLQSRLDLVLSLDQRCCEMKSWLGEISEQLRTWLNADVVGDDVPEEFSILSKEYQEYEALLREVQKMIEENSNFKNKDAAERLTNQLNELTSLFEPVSNMFLRFSRPSDFEPRMSLVKRELEHMSEQIYLLDIISLQPEDIENSLELCKKLEQSLESLESNIDYVTITGRTLAEKKQIEFPERLLAQIDSLSSRWTRHKEQVLNSKCKLLSSYPVSLELHQICQELDRCNQSCQNIHQYLEAAHSIDSKMIMLEKQFDDLITQEDKFPRIEELVGKLKPLTEDMEMIQDAFDAVKGSQDSIKTNLKEFQEFRHKLENERDENQKIFVNLSTELNAIETDLQQYTSLSSDQLNDRVIEMKVRIDSARHRATEDLTALSAEQFDSLITKLNAIGDSYNRIREKLGLETIMESSISTDLDDGRSFSELCQELRQEICDQLQSVQLASRESTAEACSRDLNNQIKIFLDFFECIFVDQNKHLEGRLHELSSMDESQTSSEYEELKKYFNEAIEQLDQRVEYIENIDIQLQELISAIKDMEELNSEECQERAYCLLRDLECEGYELPNERAKVEGFSPEKEVSEDIIPQSKPTVSETPSQSHIDRESGLKSFRESTRNVTQRLNGVRVQLDECYRGAVSRGIPDRVKIIETELDGCRDDLSNIHHLIEKINSRLTTTELFNFGCLLDAQKKRHTNYHKELRTKYHKWIEHSQRWQEYLAELERHASVLHRIETESSDNCDSAQLNSDMSTFHDRLLQLESRGQLLSTSTGSNDVDNQYVREHISELKSRLQILRDKNRKDNDSENNVVVTNGKHGNNGALSNGDSSLHTSPVTKLVTEEIPIARVETRMVSSANPTSSYSRDDDKDGEMIERFLTDVDQLLNWIGEKRKCLTPPNKFPSPGHIKAKLSELEVVERQFKSENARFESLSQMGDNLIERPPPSATEAELSLIQDKIDSLNESWNATLIELPERQMILSNQMRLWQESETTAENLLHWISETRRGIETKNYDWLVEQISPGSNRYKELTTMSANYKTVVHQCEQIGLTVPETLSAKVTQCLKDWGQLAILIKEKEKSIENGLHTSSKSLQPKTDQSIDRRSVTPVNRFTEDYEQLTLYLRGVNDFLSSNIVTLGDKFDLDTVHLHVKPHDSNQENEFTLTEKNGFSNYLTKEALLTHVQHYLHEMSAREAILERIMLAEERLSSLSSRPSDMQKKIDTIRQLWQNTSDRLTNRNSELDRMRTECGKLEKLHSELEKWLIKMDSEVETLSCTNQQNLLYYGGGGDSKSRQLQLDERLKTEIPMGQAKLQEFQSLSCQVTSDFSNEDVTKVKLNLEQMNVRWAALMSKISSRTRELVSPLSSADDTNLLNTTITGSKLSAWLENSEARLEALGREAADRTLIQNQSTRIRLIEAVKDLQNEIDSRASDLQVIGASTEYAGSAHINHFNNRWNKLREKATDVRFMLENNPDTWAQFLSRLRQLNEWLANKDSDFKELFPIGGDLSTVQRQFDIQLSLIQELSSQRDTIDGALKQGEVFLEDSERRSYNESEGESESGSESTGEDKTKRVTRRIRRNLHHLKKRWMEINSRLKEHQEKLTAVLDRLKLFEEVMTEATSRLNRVEAMMDQWISAAQIPRDSREKELDRMETFHKQECLPLNPLLDSLNAQANELQEIGIILSHTVVSRLEALKTRLNRIKDDMQSRQSHLMEAWRRDSSAHAPVPMPPDIGGRHSAMQSELGSGGGVPPESSMSSMSPSEYAMRSSVQQPWERCMHPSGNNVPFYKNHLTQETQWDHPSMSDLLQSLQEFNNIRFSAYRTASKLRSLQKELCLDFVSVRAVADTFHQHHLNRCSNEKLIDVNKIILCLTTLFQNIDHNMQTEATDWEKSSTSCGPQVGCTGGGRHSMRRRRRHPLPPLSSYTATAINGSKGSNVADSNSFLYIQRRVTVTICVDLVLNWLLNLYDSTRSGYIRILSLKIAIVLLCGSHLDEKYQYLYSLVADQQNNLNQRGLSILLQDCIQLPRQLGESAFFGGSNVEPSVRSCFEKMEETETKSRHKAYQFDDGNREQLAINLHHFQTWLRLDPQSIIWLPVLHRLSAAEISIHHLKCAVCKAMPIRGIRYRCLRCFNVDLCQACFFMGKVAKSHKLAHPMQEYCNHTSSGENIRDISRIVRNRLKSKEHFKKPSKLGYLPVQNANDPNRGESPSSTPNQSLTRGSSLSRVPSTPQGPPRYASQSHMRSLPYAGSAELPRHHIRASTEEPQETSISRYRHSLNDSREDEHNLIAHYSSSLRRKCSLENNLQSPMQIMMSMTNSIGPDFSASPMDPVMSESIMSRSMTSNYGTVAGSGRLDTMIQSLEEENRQLNLEYERLRAETPTPSTIRSVAQHQDQLQRSLAQLQHLQQIQKSRQNQHSQMAASQGGLGPNTSLNSASLMMGGSLGRHGMTSPIQETQVDEMLQEARLLRQHKGRLEARMQVLEDHNKQLESQLGRLRNLLTTPGGSNSPSNIQTSSASDADLYTSQQYATARRTPSFLSPQTQHHYNNYNTISGASSHQHVLQPIARHSQLGSASPLQQLSKYQQPNRHSNYSTISYISKPRTASESAASLSGRDFHTLSDNNLNESCTNVPYAKINFAGSNHSSINNLFQRASQVGKAVGQLVNVINDDITLDPAATNLQRKSSDLRVAPPRMQNVNSDL